MTKLTEDILRAQTCPFKLEPKNENHNVSIEVLMIGANMAFITHEKRGDWAMHIASIIEDYKLPEPEPKLVTMYECVDTSGVIAFLSESFQMYHIKSKNISDMPASARIPNGRTMQLDISGETWQWVVE